MFIFIKDCYERDICLNTNHIICVKPYNYDEYVGVHDIDLKNARSRIEYGSGFMGEIFTGKNVAEIHNLINGYELTPI